MTHLSAIVLSLLALACVIATPLVFAHGLVARRLARRAMKCRPGSKNGSTPI